MNAIDILSRCRDAKFDIERITGRIVRLRECANGCTTRMSQTGHTSGTAGGDKLAAFVAEIDECEHALAQRRREHECEMLAACKLVDRLPEAECGVLYRYYVNGQTVGCIARAMSYTPSYVKKKKADGVRLLDRVPQAEVMALLPAWYCDR